MSEETKSAEERALAQTAATSAEIAAANLRKYLETHESGDHAKFVMRIADEADADLRTAVDGAVQAAMKNLERYRKVGGG